MPEAKNNVDDKPVTGDDKKMALALDFDLNEARAETPGKTPAWRASGKVQGDATRKSRKVVRPHASQDLLQEQAHEAAAQAFKETLKGIDLDEAALADPVEFGRQCALRPLAATLWRKQLSALGDLLDQDEVQRRMGPEIRRRLGAWFRSGRLLGLDTSDGRILYPAFQFGQNGQPIPTLKMVLNVFRGAAKSPYTVATWLASPNPLLGQRTPASWMSSGGNTATLKEAARQRAAELAC